MPADTPNRQLIVALIFIIGVMGMWLFKLGVQSTIHSRLPVSTQTAPAQPPVSP